MGEIEQKKRRREEEVAAQRRVWYTGTQFAPGRILREKERIRWSYSGTGK